MSSRTEPPALLTALLDLSQQLVQRTRRRGAARLLARVLGADDLLLVVHDAEVDALLPAPGFPQTLPDGRAWRSFFADTAAAGLHAAELPWPEGGQRGVVVGIAANDGTQAVVFGGAPRQEDLTQLRPVLPLVAAAVRGEWAAEAARAQAALARQRATEAEALALSLDQARAQVEALAQENGRLYRETQEAVRLRDQFLSIASHELKTPVAGVKAAAQVLQRVSRRGDASAERVQELLQRIVTAADRLALLTDDLLDVSQVQQGQLPLRLEHVDLAAVVERVIGEWRDRPDAAAAVSFQVEDSVPSIVGDPVRLEQVVSNLLDNAIKYSPTGGTIQVTVGQERDGVRLRVRDQGIGLPSGSEAAIFEPFGRAANAQESHLPGMGLGLHICRQIVAQHAGTLQLSSRGEGEGTTADVWLPRVPTPAQNVPHS